VCVRVGGGAGLLLCVSLPVCHHTFHTNACRHALPAPDTSLRTPPTPHSSKPKTNPGRGTDILLGGNADYMARLKLRELLMPAVVSQTDETDDAYAKSRAGKAKVRSFAADPSIFPCEVCVELERWVDRGFERGPRVCGACCRQLCGFLLCCFLPHTACHPTPTHRATAVGGHPGSRQGSSEISRGSMGGPRAATA
jgi:hypothetical protein